MNFEALCRSFGLSVSVSPAYPPKRTVILEVGGRPVCRYQTDKHSPPDLAEAVAYFVDDWRALDGFGKWAAEYGMGDSPAARVKFEETRTAVLALVDAIGRERFNMLVEARKAKG